MPDPRDPDPAPAPRLAMLFWFYRDLDECRARVRLLRRLNPATPIYGLYGGEPEGAPAAQAALGDVLDDLHCHAGDEDAQYRWIHGDQVIARWHAERGRDLAWDSLVVVQWDLLIAAPIGQVLAGLRAGAAVFSGDRPLAEVEAWWGWGGAGDAHQRGELAQFRAWLGERYGYGGPLWCCLFIAAVLPRAFLDRYAAEAPARPGFLEYKLPTLARVFGTPVQTFPRLRPWWRAEPATRDAPTHDRLINATRTPVDPALIAAELARPDGARVFHPVFRTPEELAA